MAESETQGIPGPVPQPSGLVKPGAQTTEYGLAKAGNLVALILMAVGGALAALPQEGRPAWVGMAITIVGALKMMMTNLGYFRARADVKSAAGATIVAILLALAMPARAQAPDPKPDPSTTRTFGGCNSTGTFCAGPSILLPLSGYNLTTRTVVANFTPGVGYGITVYPKQWYAAGLDVFIGLKPPIGADPQEVKLSLMVKFASYVRVGVARQIIDGKASWVVPIGLGLDVP